MAMNMETGGGKSVAPAMNVTPLVDVVLVLLIIFMVITPLLTKRFWVHTPKQEKEEVTQQEIQSDPDPPLVLHVAAGGTISVNGTTVGFDELTERLKRFFAAREDHILFFDADADAEYGYAVEVMDRARAGGAVTIATLTEGLSSAPGAGAPTDTAAPLAAP
ncbi:MAG: biopolymer transporter ExbD [Deltaproteobacteria bacterium]|nr:biopolymer transporter ExbD [Deltaproteobacteria bacterium]